MEVATVGWVDTVVPRKQEEVFVEFASEIVAATVRMVVVSVVASVQGSKDGGPMRWWTR